MLQHAVRCDRTLMRLGQSVTQKPLTQTLSLDAIHLRQLSAFLMICKWPQVRRLRMPDARNMYGSTSVLNRMYGYEKKRLHATLREMLFRNTPSARR